MSIYLGPIHYIPIYRERDRGPIHYIHIYRGIYMYLYTVLLPLKLASPICNLFSSPFK